MRNLGFKLWRWAGRKCGWYAGQRYFTVQDVAKNHPFFDMAKAGKFPEGLGSAIKMTNEEMEATFRGKEKK